MPELLEHTTFADAIVETVAEPLLVLDGNLTVERANPAFYRAFSATAEETLHRRLYDLGDGQWNIPELRRLLEVVLTENSRVERYRVEHRFEDIGQRVMLLNGRRLDHHDLILLAIRDVTEQREAQHVQETLLEELRHRVNNILNNVRALAAHTRRSADTIEGFYEAFEARLNALSRAQDHLVKRPSEAVGIHEVVRAELDAVGAEEGQHFMLEGPEVRLSPRQVQALSMTIHELTTNAAKYGALSGDSGRIEILWRACQRENESWLNIHWRERGVTIPNTTPSKGFGTRIIEGNLPHMLAGTADLTFHPDGVACSLEFPLTSEAGSEP
jgi:two-component sensor histidine kinase